MAVYVGLETSGHILLEDGSGGLLLEESPPDGQAALSVTDWAALVTL